MIKLIQGNLIYYILLLTAHLGLVWWLPYFPTQDGPSHIYNLVILHDLLNGGKDWGSFFSYQLRAVPNLGFNLIAYPLLYFFPPLVIEKIFISIYIVLMGVSVPFFLRTFNKPSLPFAYFVFPVLFNFSLLMGFYSYVVAIPLFLLAFSFAWKIRNSSLACKFICFNSAGFIIFYFHLIPFVFFMLALIAITVVESTGYKKKINNLLKLLIAITPSIFYLFFYLRGTKSSIPDFSYLLSFFRPFQLLDELFFFSTVNFYWQILPASLFMSLFVLFGYLSIKNIYQRRLQFGNITPSEKSLICLSSVLILIYLFAPIRFGDGYYFNQRFPWVILLITLPLLRTPETTFFKRFGSIVITGIVSVFFAFNAIILLQQSTKVERFLSGLCAGLPKCAFVMTYKTKPPERSRVDVLLHAASYYGIFRGCIDIGNYETGSGYFPISFNKNLPALPPIGQIAYEPATINFSNYPYIQYLLGWEIDKKDRKELSKFFHIIWEEDQFSIWQREA